MNTHSSFSLVSHLLIFLLSMTLCGCGYIDDSAYFHSPHSGNGTEIDKYYYPIICDSCDDPVVTYDVDHFSDRFYDPTVLPLDKDQVRDFQPCLSLTLQNCRQNSLVYLGEYTHKWFGNPRLWTMVVKKSLEREWIRRKGIITENGDRLLHLTVTNVQLSWQTQVIECRVTGAVQTGDGDIYRFTAIHTDKNIYGSCDMAIRKSVAAILNAQEIREYLLDCCVTDCLEPESKPIEVHELKTQEKVDQTFQPEPIK